MLKQGYAQQLQSKRLSFSNPTKTSLPQFLIKTGESKEGFVAKYSSLSLLMGSLTLGNFLLCALGPYAKVSACIQKAVTNVCSGMFLREMHHLQDGCFETSTLHYSMHAHCQQSFKSFWHIIHTSAYMRWVLSISSIYAKPLRVLGDPSSPESKHITSSSVLVVSQSDTGIYGGCDVASSSTWGNRRSASCGPHLPRCFSCEPLLPAAM